MGYGSYLLPDGREAGYNIVATCDHPTCDVEIDRGLGYLCGRSPDGHREDHEPGCGRYFCWENDHIANHDCPNPDGRCETCDGEPCPECGRSASDYTAEAIELSPHCAFCDDAPCGDCIPRANPQVSAE